MCEVPNSMNRIEKPEPPCDDKLERCPFCGEHACYLDETLDDCRVVFCRNLNCNSGIKFKRIAATKEEIINAWNRREVLT